MGSSDPRTPGCPFCLLHGFNNPWEATIFLPRTVWGWVRDLGHGTACARNTLAQKELGKQEESFHMIGVAVLEAFSLSGLKGKEVWRAG